MEIERLVEELSRRTAQDRNPAPEFRPCPIVSEAECLEACRRRIQTLARHYVDASRGLQERYGDEPPPSRELLKLRREQAFARTEYELLFCVVESGERLRQIRLSQWPLYGPPAIESPEERDAAADYQRALEQLRVFEAEPRSGREGEEPLLQGLAQQLAFRLYRDLFPERQRETEYRARNLLKRVLTEAQWEEYRGSGFVTVDGKRFRYRIYPAGACIFDRRTDSQIAHTCLQFSAAGPPAEDRMLAEYLLLRNDEERYLKTANVFWVPLLRLDRTMHDRAPFTPDNSKRSDPSE